MKSDLTYICFVLDTSGSMQMVRGETITSFNKFIEEQKELPGEALFSLVEFNSTYKRFPTQNIKDVKPLDFRPGGFTALLDAQGYAIQEVGKELDAMSEHDKPSKVIFVTLTDGEENASRKYTIEQVKSMIQHQTQAYNWEFVYLGANQDAIAVAKSMGIQAGSTLTYSHNDKGIRNTVAAASTYVRSVRSMGQAVFTDDDRKNSLQ